MKTEKNSCVIARFPCDSTAFLFTLTKYFCCVHKIMFTHYCFCKKDKINLCRVGKFPPRDVETKIDQQHVACNDTHVVQQTSRDLA